MRDLSGLGICPRLRLLSNVLNKGAISPTVFDCAFILSVSVGERQRKKLKKLMAVCGCSTCFH